jgi:hypothetical protein
VSFLLPYTNFMFLNRRINKSVWGEKQVCRPTQSILGCHSYNSFNKFTRVKILYFVSIKVVSINIGLNVFHWSHDSKLFLSAQENVKLSLCMIN